MSWFSWMGANPGRILLFRILNLLLFLPSIYKTCFTPSLTFFYLLLLGSSRAPRVARTAGKERPEGESLFCSHLLVGPIFSVFSIITSPPTSEASPAIPYCWHGDYTLSHRRSMTTRSVTFLDYGAFSQALVCFGSSFDQAVRLLCQVPFVKLEGKQP